MARLRRLAGGPARPVQSSARIGRDPASELHVDEPLASRAHALLYWTGDGWKIRDLASRNGTWLGGRRLGPGDEAVLGKGDVIGVGSDQGHWEVLDTGPPCAMAVPLDGGEPIGALGDVLVLPGLVLRAAEGTWRIVRDNEEELVGDGQIVEVGGDRWRLLLPAPAQETARGVGPGVGWTLVLRASEDEERVHVLLRGPAGAVDLKARSHHRILWVLARERTREERRGAAREVAGWVQPDELRQFLGMVSSTFYVHLFRLRQQLAQEGLDHDGLVLERRATGEIRIGAERLDLADLTERS